MNVRRLVACLGTTIALTLTACTAGPTPSPSTTMPVPASATRDINELPRERIREGGLLRFALTNLPSQWNPHHPSADADALSVLAPLTPSHFSLDAAGRARPNPDFVIGVEVSSTPATQVELHLNPRARWGDGTPITAADWIATWRAATGGVEGLELTGLQAWRRVSQVRQGATPADVVITFHGTDPDWAEPLVPGPLRGDALTDAAAANWSSYDPARYAAPFTVAHVDATQGLITLEPSPQWWGDPAKLTQVMFRTVPTEAVAAAFQHNELDVWAIGTSTERLQQSRTATDTTLRSAPGRKGRLLEFGRDGALSDPAVRKALILALDRDRLSTDALGTAPGAPPTWSNALLLPTQPGYVDQARATGLGFDPTQAAQTLEASGWKKDTSGHRIKDGRPLELSYGVPSNDPMATEEFPRLVEQLAGVGISLRLVTGRGDLTPTIALFSPFPLAQLPTAADRPELAELVTKVRIEQDAVRRADQASQLARALWQDADDVTLYQLPQQVAVRNGLANFGAPAFSTTDWEDVGWAT